MVATTMGHHMYRGVGVEMVFPRDWVNRQQGQARSDQLFLSIELEGHGMSRQGLAINSASSIQ